MKHPVYGWMDVRDGKSEDFGIVVNSALQLERWSLCLPNTLDLNFKKIIFEYYPGLPDASPLPFTASSCPPIRRRQQSNSKSKQ